MTTTAFLLQNCAKGMGLRRNKVRWTTSNMKTESPKPGRPSHNFECFIPHPQQLFHALFHIIQDCPLREAEIHTHSQVQIWDMNFLKLQHLRSQGNTSIPQFAKLTRPPGQFVLRKIHKPGSLPGCAMCMHNVHLFQETCFILHKKNITN